MKTAAILAVAILALGAMLWAEDDAVVAPQPTANLQSKIENPRSVDAVALPQMMTYQGRLSDATGAPVPNGDYSITFKLYPQLSGGNSFWMETQKVVTRDGLFSVLLGSVTPVASAPAAGEVYLGMAVAGSDEMTPRLRIAGTYALPTQRAGANDNKGGGTDDDDEWVRSSPADSVLYTIRRLGVARGGCGNVLYGNWTCSMTNLGSACTTGISGTPGLPLGNMAVLGGYGNRTWAPYTSVGGGRNNKAGNDAADTSAIVVGGYGNKANAKFSYIAGGQNNTADGVSASIGGGSANSASATYTSIGGGRENRASGDYAVASGGYGNTASGVYAVVSGGVGNGAPGYDASVGGGICDSAKGPYCGVLAGRVNLAGDDGNDTGAVVVGGAYNRATGMYATIDGGLGNTASGFHSATIAGGYGNTASGYSGATIGGGGVNTASGNYTTVGGGIYNAAVSVNAATVGGGESDTVKAYYGGVFSGRGNLAGDAAADSGAVVAGGGYNRAVGLWSSVGGGTYNIASAEEAVVAGGGFNTASGFAATVGGGDENEASDEGATVAGGEYNIAWGYNSAVGGGEDNIASGDDAVVPGGDECSADGDYSFATGYASEVPYTYENSAAFNSTMADEDYEVRCDILHSNSMVFALDDPLDPQGSIMNQFAVGSPEIVVTFRGSAVIGADGRVTAELPRYFDALCKNPSVQLTGVGNADVFVAADVAGNRFTIGGQPGTKVYWQVTGERKDQLAEITRVRMPVQERRTGALVGRSISDASLAGSMPELQRLGLGGRYSFHTAVGQKCYQDLLKKRSEAAQHRSARPVQSRPERKQHERSARPGQQQ